MWLSDRKVGDRIRIGDDIVLKILHITDDRVAFGLTSVKEGHLISRITILPKEVREQAVVQVRIAK